MPRICFVNKMDRIGANYWRTVAMIVDRLNARPAPIQIPIGAEGGFKGYIDLIEQQAVVFVDDLGTKSESTDIPADLAEDAKKHRDELIEKVAETDEELTMKYLEGETITNDELRKALRAATIKGKLVPVLCGSALKNKGVQAMLDAVVEYLPSPLEIPAPVVTDMDTEQERELIVSDDGKFVALAFKIVADPFVGRLCYFRVYSGTLNKGSYVANAAKGKKERISRLLQMHANHREDIDVIYSGDICAAVGLKDTFTGDTLCEPDHPVLLENIVFPEPVIAISIEPKTRNDQDKMAIALQRLAEEDPTFRVHTDEESAQTIIEGMGELHLDVLVDRMFREYKVEANIGRPQVAYRETITRKAEAEGRFIRQSGGRGQYGDVWIRVEPLERGKGLAQVGRVVAGSKDRHVGLD